MQIIDDTGFQSEQKFHLTKHTRQYLCISEDQATAEAMLCEKANAEGYTDHLFLSIIDGTDVSSMQSFVLHRLLANKRP